MQPHVSIIMPVFNAAATLDRTIETVAVQSVQGWELLAIDDCSTDGSFQMLYERSARDARIRVFQTAESGGLGAARNIGLRQATAKRIAYLDVGDEYYSDYLDSILGHDDKGEVLIFAYDQRQADGSITACSPAGRGNDLFWHNIAPPLAVSHRRSLPSVAGAFNERIWRDSAWEYWKRLARCGAEFAFLPAKSGIHSPSRNPAPPTARQRALAEANWQAGKPLFADNIEPMPRRAAGKIAFAAPSSIIDPSSGAAISTRRGLEFLAQHHFECQAFCATKLDFSEEVPFEQVLQAHGARYGARTIQAGKHSAQIFEGSLGPVAFSVFQTQSSRSREFQEGELETFLRLFQEFLARSRPDVLVTYGGDAAARAMMRMAKGRDIPIVFWLKNCQYGNPESFADVDYVLVPSEFSRRFHWEKLGLACQVLPNIIRWNEVQCQERQPKFVTFVTPQPAKGLFIFARIAEQLAIRRPDIPILVVEGRAGANWRSRLGPAEDLVRTVSVQPYVSDPKVYFGVSKLLLAPSLWNEAFGTVTAEAMINGIPVLASNRGGLPETVGDAGYVFDIPARYTSQTELVPEPDEVEPWIDTIIRLWDDAALYEAASRRALEHAQKWRPERLLPLYEDFFRNVSPQPGPPLVPSLR